MADNIKSALKLQPHPAGGFYSEIYRDNSILTKAQADVQWLVEQRACSSHIYFLMVGADFDKLHRVRCDEGFSYTPGTLQCSCIALIPTDPLPRKLLTPRLSRFTPMSRRARGSVWSSLTKSQTPTRSSA